MKGTTGRKVLARLLELYMPVDDIHDVDAAQQLLNEVLRDHDNDSSTLRVAGRGVAVACTQT
jgi:DNA-binding phage protein